LSERFKDKERLASLNGKFFAASIAPCGSEAAEQALEQLADELLGLLDVSSLPVLGSDADANDPTLEALIGSPPSRLQRPFPDYPSITGWDLPPELLVRLDREMHTQGGRKAVHVQESKRQGPLARRSRPRARVRDGIVEGIFQTMATPAEMLAGLDKEAGDVEMEVTLPRLIGEFLWAHRWVARTVR